MSSFDEKLTAHQSSIDAQYDRELDRSQELSDKIDELHSIFSDMFAEVLKQQVTELKDLPSDPESIVEDVKDMILDMWEDYCG